MVQKLKENNWLTLNSLDQVSICSQGGYVFYVFHIFLSLGSSQPMDLENQNSLPYTLWMCEVATREGTTLGLLLLFTWYCVLIGISCCRRCIHYEHYTCSIIGSSTDRSMLKTIPLSMSLSTQIWRWYIYHVPAVCNVSYANDTFVSSRAHYHQNTWQRWTTSHNDLYAVLMPTHMTVVSDGICPEMIYN